MVKKILGSLFILFAVVGFIIFATSKSTEALPPAIIFAVIGIVLLLVKGKTNEQKAQLIANKEKGKTSLWCKHTAGLPLAEGTQCIVAFDVDGLTISGSGNTFKLPYDRITDLQMKSEVEIQKAYVSSIGGAVGGAVLFGPLGAIVGGRAKEKKTKTIDYYFIITYNKDENIEYLSFWTADNFKAGKLITEKRGMLSGKAATVTL